MNKKEWKRRMAYEALILLGLLALLLFITRLWPILLLVILGIFVAALRLLFLSPREVKTTQPTPLLPAPASTAQEPDLKAQGYAHVLRQITDRVLADYPDARWIWEKPNSRRMIEAGEPSCILLNRAGGYRKAQVQIVNYQVTDVIYLSGEAAPAPSPDAPKAEPESEVEPLPENYELLAFEWVEANLLRLNEEINEAIGLGKAEHLLAPETLPVRESWEDICQELQRNGLEQVVADESGIHIIIEQ